MMNITFHPIGIIHTPLRTAEETPIQTSRSEVPGEIEVYPENAEGLDGIEEFSHLILLCYLHQAPPERPLVVKPFLDDRTHGVFATRFPHRPNPIGLSVVRLVGRGGSRLSIAGLDMFDGTPVLDIKPYVPDFDVFPAERVGWYSTRAFK
jgi:tRNA-Thr(GGU) m(6)t(6)A37 methyltransferase TsaA